MKKRIDLHLVEQGFYDTRHKAQVNIMAGNVYADGVLTDKAGALVDEKCKITIKQELVPYVGRGGLKLEKALEVFNIKLDSKICMDVGASTGGFTDCMLQNGAKKVYAIDVGYNQLAYKLRIDQRVVCMERTNFRYIENEKVPDKIEFATVDVSFISLTKILPKLKELMAQDYEIVTLIKPQFESKRQEVNKGIIKDEKIHKRVIKEIVDFAGEIGIVADKITFSPITGQKGNIEYLAHFVDKGISLTTKDIDKAVEESHANF